MRSENRYDLLRMCISQGFRMCERLTEDIEQPSDIHLLLNFIFMHMFASWSRSGNVLLHHT